MKNLLSPEMKDYVIPTNLSRKMTIGGETKAYPIYRVRLDQLFYNDQNDRIATWISQYHNQHGNHGLTLLEQDEYNAVIESFIIQSNPTSIDKTQMNIELIGQREPGVVLQDGRLIDGNRRFTCLRRLSEKDEKFNWFETVILESSLENNRKQIKMLELSIQHGEEKKVDYNPLDRLVGVYQDIVESGMLTVEEYAESTNESVFDVRKRVAQAQMLVEFLEYIHMPKQYYVAREYQLVTILSELQDFLKKVSDAEKQQVKEVVFANVMMKTIGDSRKFIRNLNSMLGNGYLQLYLKEQKRISDQLQEKLRQSPTGSRYELDRFVSENEDMTEELQLSTDKQLLKAKRAETRGKPSQIVSKSITMLKGVDTRIFEKLNDTERDKLRLQVSKLSQMIDRIDDVVGGDPMAEKPISTAEKQAGFPSKVEKAPERYWIAPLKQNAPMLLCVDFGKKINSLSFTLRFSTYGNMHATQPCEYRLFFVDQKQKPISDKIQLRIAAGEEKQATFLLHANISSEKICYLAIQAVDAEKDALLQLLPFEVDMLFAVDTLF